ncbi:MAG: NAD-dependent protein deacylase [Deltaproteobacteria bacterium]|nr:MAG: NAD-dependent protein deacylase [Deltaproteobacteria bacterium]
MVPIPRVGPGAEFEPLRIGRTERVFVLTGAGVSAESGVRTFRDAGGAGFAGDGRRPQGGASIGLWYEHRIEDVATAKGFERDPRMVWRFYSERRRQLPSVKPNPAHQALARLAQEREVFLCTQNVDDLHERAGSPEVVHMHGELLRSRCHSCERPSFVDAAGYFEEPPRCRCGGLLRPHVVWFGEIPFHLERIFAALDKCDLFLCVGSSGAVHPAAGFVSHLRHTGRARCIYLGLERPDNAYAFDECRLGKAGELLPGLVDLR